MLFIYDLVVADLTINMLFITLSLTTIFGERYLVIRYLTHVIKRITLGYLKCLQFSFAMSLGEEICFFATS